MSRDGSFGQWENKKYNKGVLANQNLSLDEPLQLQTFLG